MRAEEVKNVKLVNAYFKWLCDKIDVDAHDDYFSLLQYLHRKEFFWSVPNDDNRAADGRHLREAFCREAYDCEDEDLSDFEAQCSVFEMLVALAEAFEFQMAGTKVDHGPGPWFWMFLENLDLLKHVDKKFDFTHLCIVNEKLDTFLERTYNKKGERGLFPLKNPKEDQRKVEIIYQMHAYIAENYIQYILGED